MKLLYTFAVFVALFLAGSYAHGQRSVSGTVTDGQGEPLIGASVRIAKLAVGTVTDLNGYYALQVTEENPTLIFSFVGFREQRITLGLQQTELNATLQPGLEMEEVIVTGLGIERERKALGYSVQNVESDALNPVLNTNVIEGLGGKASGIQVINSSGASLGGTSKIRIRGATSLTGAEPLFIIDGTPISNENFSSSSEWGGGIDYGSLINDINPEDIESLSILKGPSATAIYGERGKHGVVLITMKKGTKRQGIGVEVNTSFMADEVYVLPTYQNEYAGGYTQDWIVDPVSGDNILNYAADESWGPRIDGTLYRPWWSWYEESPDYGQKIPLTANPDNVRSFFNTGQTFNNSIALTGGGPTTQFRLSYKNINQQGVIPNSKLVKNNIGIVTSTDLTDRLQLSANINFATEAARARPGYGYNSANIVFSFNQWFQRQLDMDRLRSYRNPDGTMRSWNIRSTTNLRPLYWDSPFFTAYENFSTDSRDRYFGNIRLSYEINESFNITGSLNRDNYSQRIEQRVASGGLEQSSYSERVVNGREDNYDLRLDFQKYLTDLSIDANIGGNIRKNDFHNNFAATTGGLNADNLFNLSASTDRPRLESFISKKEVRSVFGSLNLGYKNVVYLGGTLRNDWSSALPQDDNSYLYSSLNVSFVFSELLNASWMSYGKIRGGLAQVGSDTDPYQTQFTYESSTPHGNSASFELPTTLINSEIKPSISTSWEVGLEAGFFNNRLSFDLAYYKTKNKDEIIQLPVPGSSGYNAAWINAGEIESEGIELSLNMTPVRTKDFNWDVTFNIAQNTSRVNELADGLDNYQLGSELSWNGLSINAPVGQEWGQFRGTQFKRDDAGNIMIDEDGYFIEDRDQWLGSFLPDATGGVRTALNFRQFYFGAFVDFQIGGQFHSITRMFNAYSGLGLETVGLNDKGMPVRDPIDQGGGIRVDGVLEDGTPHTTYMEAQSYYAGLFGLHEQWLYDQSFAKLREVSIGYELPESLISHTPFTTVYISLVAKNVWLIHSNVDGLDPSEISSGSSRFYASEGGALPGVRSFGFNLRFGF